MYQEAGIDGVEIHACHGDLIQQSWSKWSNQRTDKWGEPMYFSTRIIERIREVTGRDFIISIRIPGDDFASNGMATRIIRRWLRLWKPQVG